MWNFICQNLHSVTRDTVKVTFPLLKRPSENHVTRLHLIGWRILPRQPITFLSVPHQPRSPASKSARVRRADSGGCSPHPGYPRAPSFPPRSYKNLQRLPGRPRAALFLLVDGWTLREEDEVLCGGHCHRGIFDFSSIPEWFIRRREEEGPKSHSKGMRLPEPSV